MPPSRRFTILDAMAFVAATAVGLALALWLRPKGGFLPTPGEPLDYWVWFGPPSGLAVAWGFALFLIRLRAPRPRWRRLARQPGFVASAMTIGPIPIGILLASAFDFIPRYPFPRPTTYVQEWYWRIAIEIIPTAIGGAWLALALSGRWKPEPTWVDRIGRGLGLFWVASWPYRILQPFLRYIFPKYF
jgi:hypothetical protein